MRRTSTRSESEHGLPFFNSYPLELGKRTLKKNGELETLGGESLLSYTSGRAAGHGSAFHSHSALSLRRIATHDLMDISPYSVEWAARTWLGGPRTKVEAQDDARDAARDNNCIASSARASLIALPPCRHLGFPSSMPASISKGYRGQVAYDVSRRPSSSSLKPSPADPVRQSAPVSFTAWNDNSFRGARDARDARLPTRLLLSVENISFRRDMKESSNNVTSMVSMGIFSAPDSGSGLDCRLPQSQEHHLGVCAAPPGIHLLFSTGSRWQRWQTVNKVTV